MWYQIMCKTVASRFFQNQEGIMLEILSLISQHDNYLSIFESLHNAYCCITGGSGIRVL